MKAIDIINQLKSIVPRYSNLFCDEINVISLVNVLGTVTCICESNHNLKVGSEIFINNALTPITINSLIRNGDVATAITNSNHDLTQGYQETVNIIGANQTEYNGVHELLKVQNRRTFSFAIFGTPITPATGNIKIIENIKYGYNGLHIVDSIIDDTTFTFKITSNPESPAYITVGIVKMKKNFTITGDINIERFLESYTKQLSNKFYLVVVLGGTTGSKDRYTLSDAISTSTHNNADCRTRIIDPFTIYIVIPTSDKLTAMDARDSIEDLWTILNKSILFHVFPVNTVSKINLGVAFAGHDSFMYERAYYIHAFKYEFVYDLIREDGFDDVDDSVAFRDIDLRFNSYINAKHNEIMRKLVDLDNEPLP